MLAALSGWGLSFLLLYSAVSTTRFGPPPPEAPPGNYWQTSAPLPLP